MAAPLRCLLFVALLFAALLCPGTHARSAPRLSRKDDEESRDEFRKLKKYSRDITNDINKKITHFLASTNIPFAGGLR